MPHIVLVLGKRLLRNGEPSQEFKLQVEKSVQLMLQDGKNRLLVITGGVTRPEFPSEAEVAMKLLPVYLQERAKLETKSKSTQQNVRFVKALLAGTEIDSMVVVSGYHHTERIFFLFKRFWKETVPCLLFESVGRKTLYGYARHKLMYLLIWLDPNERIFLPVKLMVKSLF